MLYLFSKNGMLAPKRLGNTGLLLALYCNMASAQNPSLPRQAEQAMYNATKFMDDSVSANGGYVWYYLPDLSRRWGEMEAFKTMIWVQDGGTVSVGHTLLDAYNVTGNEYYYQIAEKAAAALIWGQSKEGGWNYMIDFAGHRSLKQWYATIGKNGWRLEEFQHYYGNDTYDDDVTSDAARYLLRLYLEKLDPKYKPSLDKAIDFIIKSQYPNGGWPQRYPLRYDFKKAGHPDYSSYYTFNDDVIWENVNFLVQCYLTLGEERFLAPINKGMNFYILSQTRSGGWGQQYDMKMNPAGARTYEPAALLPKTSFSNANLLLKFYQYTGEKKFLDRVPAAINWLEKTRLSQSMTDNGRYTHPTFIDPLTGKPEFVHRKGSRFTIEVLFRPDSDGPVAPRFMHLEDSLANRVTFELRLTRNEEWYFDGFLKNGKTRKGVALIDSTQLHPANKWYWAALVYDGTKMYTYINGKKELDAEMDFPAMTKGNISVGVRLNKVNWFKGQVRKILFHPEVIEPKDLERFL